MSLLRGVEVWIPQGSYLLRSSAAYAALDTPAEPIPSPLLHRGEGIAGAAFSSGHAKILSGAALASSGASNGRFEVAVALPFFAGSTLLAITVLWCGAGAGDAGCFEVWEPNQLRELAHADGYYGSFSALERLSRVMRFQSGSGIPGITWERGVPLLTPELGSSTSFLRAAAAREVGIHSALSVPLYRSGSINAGAMFMSTGAAPLARGVEIWMGDSHQHLRISQAAYDPSLAAFAQNNRCVEFLPGHGLVGRVFDAGLPLALSHKPGEVFSGHVGTDEAGLSLAVGLPIHDGRQVRAVLTLLA
jgi:hypothetical protein